MNKWQIICPLAAMGIFLLLGTPAAVRRTKMNREDAITWRAYCAGRELERTTNSGLLFSVDGPVYQVLEQFLTTPEGYDEMVSRGDEPSPIGDGTATHRLYLRNGNGTWIVLRLRNDPKLEKFHVLGSFTPTNPPALASPLPAALPQL